MRLIPFRCRVKDVAKLHAREHAELLLVERHKLYKLDWAAADLQVIKNLLS